MDGYSKLPSTEKIQDQDTLSDSDCQSHHECNCASPRPCRLAWVLCGISCLVTILTVLGSSILLLRQPKVQNIGSFSTDFISAPKVPYVEKYTYNFYDFNPSNHLLEFNKTGVGKLYAGHPAKEIDDAWDELLQGNYMQMSTEEAEAIQKAAPWKLEMFDGKVYAELNVFHNLHCVNLVRRALDPEYYNVHTDFTAQVMEEYKRVHIYHCIDQLRQAIQCHSDLTPAPLFSSDMLAKRFYASHSVSSTCRNFDVVNNWMKERNDKNPPFDWS